KVLASTESNERAEKRIIELEEEQKEVGQEVADQECELFLLEEFTRAKMSLLSSNVNNHFRIVDWKMFDIQLNGGLKETCECMVNGVPFASVNAAGKIQAGIDIINTLSQLYEVSAPIWIDNRESCTDIPSVDTQVINLYVSENEKTLKVEV
ncbi:MAG: ATPase, partial [Erysipelotrichaceae bacterium]